MLRNDLRPPPFGLTGRERKKGHEGQNHEIGQEKGQDTRPAAAGTHSNTGVDLHFGSVSRDTRTDRECSCDVLSWLNF